MSIRWRRNQRLKCECGGYHFPHRRGGGICRTSKTREILLAQRAGCAESLADARVGYALKHAMLADPAVIPF